MPDEFVVSRIARLVRTLAEADDGNIDRGARRLLALRQIFVAALLVLAGMGSPCLADDAPPCDLESMRSYPMTDVLWNRALRLASPDLFFPAPDDKVKFADENGLDEVGAEKLRAALRRGLATFKPEERQVLMLAAISHWIDGDHGLLNFFVLPDGVFLDEVLEALDSQGLDTHAALFRTGRALFGVDYGTQWQRYDRWSDGYGRIRDLGLDAALRALSERYLHMRTLLSVAAGRIAATPELLALYEPLRRNAPEDKRLEYLISRLQGCLHHIDKPENVIARLKQLPTSHGRIVVVSIFENDMLNGSVEQFFFNSSGALGPEVVEALTGMGLKAHAAAVQKGIDMFPKPYPRDLDARREFMSRQSQALADALDALTGVVDDGAIRPAMLKQAQDADILPK